MHRILIIAALDALLLACAKPAPVAPNVDEPSQPVVENIETIGPAALCESATQLRSERGADGITVYWCEA